MGIFDSMIKGIFDINMNNRNISVQKQIAEKQLALAEKEYYSNVDIMNKNFGLQQEAFNYNKAQAELTRQREDNAFRRRVADYVAAGFSPLAAQGVAASSQAPTLTAPQLDPSGVNQATANRLNAYDKKMQVYQNKLQQSNFNKELRLKNMQLSLAELETARGLFETGINTINNTRYREEEVKRLQYENAYYEKHGFKNETFETFVNDIIKNVNFGDKTPGQAIADSINEVINSKDETASQVITKKVHNKADNMFINNLKNDDKINEFINLLEEANKGHFSYFAIDKLENYARFNFGFDLDLKSDRVKSLSKDEVDSILNRFYQYKNSRLGSK